MYNFKMPSKLVQRGEPLPQLPAGIGMPMPQADSMQPDQTAGIEQLMANYRPPQPTQQTPSFGFYGTQAPQMPTGFGMPVRQPQMGQNQPYGQPSSGPSFFTL